MHNKLLNKLILSIVICESTRKSTHKRTMVSDYFPAIKLPVCLLLYAQATDRNISLHTNVFQLRCSSTSRYFACLA